MTAPKTGITYVITHPGYGAVKVGYTTPNAVRLEEFGRRGWRLYRTLDSATPGLAREIEQATLFDLRFRRYVPAYLTQAEVKPGGWTETSSLALISARDLWVLVCEQAGLIQLHPEVKRPLDRRRFNGGTPPIRRRGDALPNSVLARKQARLEQITGTTKKEG